MYANADMSKFDFTIYGKDLGAVGVLINKFWQHFEPWEREGKGLYIWSSTKGSGKTFLSCCLATSIREKYHRNIKFISCVEYLQKVKDSYNRQREEEDHTRVYLNCDILVLDDVGSEKSGDWQSQELFRLVDYRLCNGKIIIATSNIPMDELKCDSRIIDRLASMCIPIQLPEESIRRKKTQERNDRFLKSIMTQ
jgi:DNA replication protein DnaC